MISINFFYYFNTLYLCECSFLLLIYCEASVRQGEGSNFDPGLKVNKAHNFLMFYLHSLQGRGEKLFPDKSRILTLTNHR